MSTNRTGVDGTLVLQTRLQMFLAGLHFRFKMTMLGAAIGALLAFTLHHPQSVPLDALQHGLDLGLVDALRLEAGLHGWVHFYPRQALLVFDLPRRLQGAGTTYLLQAKHDYWHQYLLYLYSALTGALLFWWLVAYWGRRETRLRESDRYVRGARLVTAKELKKEIDEPSKLSIAGVPVPRQAELPPWSFVGRPRQGKTVAIKSILDQIENAGLKIIFDSKGDYCASHFRNGDLVFAPSVDRRSVRWNLFNDVTSLSQVTAIAAALIPEAKGNGQMFATGARQILEGLLLHCIHSGKKTNTYLWEVCTLPPRQMRDLLAKTPGGEQGAALLDKPDTPTAFSFYVNLSSYLKPVQLLAKTDGDFSIRQWLATADQGGSNRLFILSNPDHQEALRPVLNLFLNTLLTAHLSMPDNLNRRVYYILDELAVLPRVPKLMDALNFGPSKGLVAILGYQSFQQLDELYGREQREAIVSACGTHLFFSVGSKATADVAVDIIGREEVLESRGTLSTGITDGRHGGSMMEQSRTKELVTADEIKDLQPLNAILKFLGFPAAPVAFKYKPYPAVAPAIDPDPDFDLERYLVELAQIKARAGAGGGDEPAPVAAMNDENEQQQGLTIWF